MLIRYSQVLTLYQYEHIIKIMIKGTFIFDWLNDGLEITNPTLTINPDGIIIYPTKMSINVPIVLTITGAKFGILLEDVTVQDFNYDAAQLTERVLTRLNDYKI